ncbi:biosynthetic-type acetolactate synthase large subunit [Clostridium thermarum]|uniref:biosynthetic-type acetolactate synthase large subunit n=1 Tax=Clostridium thermarum TaxID=1716543 RepID=UPI0013D0E0F5|nr:biosynthetic-type acetolactate synthase large subunit [Clostridium thermarum]
MKLSGAEITIKLLERQGIKHIAGIPGGANLPIYDALYDSSINHILARHEQGAAFIAQGMARSNGRAAVCFATSGPGATNLLTAIADAKLDSIPIIAITGQVSYTLIGTDAFQEVDTYGLTVPITKHNFFIRSIEELFTVIPEAFKIAEEGRQGPVLIDIPKNIQVEEYEFDKWPEPYVKNSSDKKLDYASIEKAADMICRSKRPILYIGGGVISSEAHENIYKLAKKNSIPVAATLMALGSFPCSDFLYLGMLGMHGAKYTNMLMDEADLVIALGVRFDDRATGNIKKFCPNAKIIHVDIDAAEINKIKTVDVSILGDLNHILEELIDKVKEDGRPDWMKEVREYKEIYPFNLPSTKDVLHPINLIRFVGSIVGEDSIIITDVGQHQMWTAQAYPFKKPRTFLTSGGLGTMGFGLPTAIGAALVNPDKTVVCFSGDGSILMNIQELATLADLKLKVKLLIMNNGHLGLVRQQQEMFYNQKYMASKFKTNPDFAAISKGFGINSCNLGRENDPLTTLNEILLSPEAFVVDIPIKEDENVLPMVPPGAGNTVMRGGEGYGK